MIYLQPIAMRWRMQAWDFVDANFAEQVRRRNRSYYRKLKRRFATSIISKLAAWIGGKVQP